MSGAFKHAVAWMLLVCACGSGSDKGSLTLSPSETTLVPGQTATLVARDENGQVVAASWQTSSPETVTVSPSGMLQGVAAGSADVTAATDGASGTARVTVRDGGMVTSAGGRISALGGRVTLDVPAGAVAAPTAVAIVGEEGGPLDPRVVGRTQVSITVDGTFLAPAALEIGYEPARGPIGLPTGRFRLAVLDADVWREVADSHDDPGRLRVGAPFTASGTFAVRQGAAVAPCTAAEDRQFDFWLGEWDIHSTGGGGGHSEITRDAAGCNIDERFTERNTVGLSVSFFNPDDQQWHQTYVDNAGGRLVLSGRFVNDEMVLTSPQATQMTRITWSIVGSEVRQFGESSADGGASWSPAFEGFYARAR